MKIIKTGDVPALISNVEVMKLIRKNIESYQKEDAGEETAEGQEEYIRSGYRQKEHMKKRTNIKSKQKRWIEERVLEYIESTPCAKVDFDRLPKLVKRLRSNSSNIKEKKKGKDDQTEKMNGISNGSASTPAPLSSEDHFGLTDAETLQVLNLIPQELVEYHLIVEDISSRMSEERQIELIDVVKEYIVKNKDVDNPNKEDEEMADATVHQEKNDEIMTAEAIFSAPPAKNNKHNGNMNGVDHHETDNMDSASVVTTDNNSVCKKTEPSRRHIRVKTEPV